MAAYFFLIPVGLVINSIPITPGGLGTAEAAYAAMFGAFGSNAGAEIAALWHILFFGWSIIGMVLYVKGKKAYDTTARAIEAVEAPDGAVDLR